MPHLGYCHPPIIALFGYSDSLRPSWCQIGVYGDPYAMTYPMLLLEMPTRLDSLRSVYVPSFPPSKCFSVHSILDICS
jgi:hypothetical protein